ncbi:MAG: hypothetical protein GTO51_03595 [Candidatus Latescibacteria bacterium]|nr:hypothetical protein [Candidatus Latescibacterota bacterium]NIM20923.1 hypothetical protein [Candidatus Latescibacterota bacterium]NIM65058.1 hypothetical protein [Candidatus Latescibacterota bacterium]NIO01573.1 hypothetical protein [Candidatus Latescibacterota bacterium]NIO28090.1 hypothetical protein [Candidatus Latescibacterota bacterium]
MSRNMIAALIGILSLILLVVGATLYAVNSPYRSLTNGLLVLGAAIFIAFVVLNFKAITDFSKKRSSRYGVNMLAVILLFTCILVIVQAVSSRHSHRFDLTRNKRFSLAGQTANLLKSLDKDIEIFAFYKRGATERNRAQDLIGQYTHQSDRLRYQFIDPDQKPQVAKDMGITSYSTVAIVCGDRKELLTTLTEESLTNAILRVFREEVKAVYIVQGHGEKDPESGEIDGYSIMKKAIEAENYTVSVISLFEEESIPDDCYILLIAGPTKDYFESEIEKIKDYLARGRGAIFMVDPKVEVPNLQKLIAEYQIELDDNIIIDPFSRIFGGDYTVPVVSQYESHPITKNFNVATFFPLARSLRINEDFPTGTAAQYLAKTGKSAWGEMDLDGIKLGRAALDAQDVQAPVPIAAIGSREVDLPDSLLAGDKKPRSKIIVFGDSDFAGNSSFRISGNSDFLLNTISFLAEEEDLISIRPKEALGDRIFLTASQGRLVFLLCVVLLPLAVISIGTTIFVKRRRSG